MKDRTFTPENITELKENEIFVFGSNKNGNHAGGAAHIAVEKFGAVMGLAEENSNNYEIKEWKAAVVDGKKIKADTWYRLEGGKFVEV